MPHRIIGTLAVFSLLGCGPELSYPAPERCLPPAASIDGAPYPVLADLEIRIPPEFRRDSSVQYFHGGARWSHGSRTIEVVGGHWSASAFRAFDLPSYTECFDRISGYDVFIVRHVQLEDHPTQPRGARASVLFIDARLYEGRPLQPGPGSDSIRSDVRVGVIGRNAAEAESLLRIVAGIR